MARSRGGATICVGPARHAAHQVLESEQCALRCEDLNWLGNLSSDVAILRDAVSALIQDTEFLAEAERGNLEIFAGTADRGR